MGYASTAAPFGGRHQYIKLCMHVGVVMLAAIGACTAQEQAPTAAPATAAPAPAPTPPWVNVTQVLALAGDYSTFVSLMMETKVDEIFQRNANQTDTGITIFAPTNEAFTTKLASTLLKNLTEQQKVSLVEYHALNNWLSLGSLQLADDNQTTTLATYNNGGGKYQLNITDDSGVVQILSGWTTANLTSTLYSQKPVSIFAINEVLLPDDIFGLPSPAPAPSPSSSAPTLAPSSSSSSSSTSGPSSGGNQSSTSSTRFTPSHTSFFACVLFYMIFTNMHI